ncbi:MAG: hypothetical protein ABIP55_01090 [Tepidisphaeraceae bacterium]
MPEPVDLAADAVLIRRQPPHTWSEIEERVTSNTFELRPGESGISMYQASLCAEADVLRGFGADWGAVVLVFGEIRNCFEASESEGETDPQLADSHIELRHKTPDLSTKAKKRKNRHLATFAAASGMPSSAAP